MDFSHVMAWQIHGTKTFCGLSDPNRWAPSETRLHYKPPNLDRPEELSEADALCYTMPPGSVLWNVLLTPHALLGVRELFDPQAMVEIEGLAYVG
jgi:hypothetical protein